MSILTTKQIRSSFIDFFKKNHHNHVPSSSLVPHNDPSLMFVNAGMVQFKDVFTGVEKRDYSKAVSSQKCVRAGGKHNDLENVGYTARHHTFFEMLGNFSFGDYFKEEAIYYAWQFLTSELQIDRNKLYITIYHDDDEAFSYWKKISGFNEDRIIRIATADNFWSMGETGPCGPCSEIFYDHGDHIYGGLPGTKDEDGDRFIEIWNLVFMQYQQLTKDKRIALPKKSVDTGMGLERISAILQNVHDNYDTDIFKEIIGFAEDILKTPAKNEDLFSYRVIADHLRSSAFLIADGVMPSNEGRGYVVRRIMRRAMRHAHQLGAKEPLMYKLLPKLFDLFAGPFPELARAQDLIASVLKQEEESFKKTLGRGLKLLDEESKNINKKGTLSGDIAFKLYDTYGFPLDLTADILKKRDIKIDYPAFEKQMENQKERARKSWSGSGQSKTDNIWFEILSQFGPTEFLGYSHKSSEGNICAIVEGSSQIKQFSKKGKKFTLISNQTPFYGESGGQMGDVGIIESDNCKIKVIDSLKYLGKIIAHICEIEEGSISVGDKIKMSFDENHRQYLKIHHTATHILHAVLRDIVGKHVVQKGSLVAQDKLRFDISHPKALTKEEIFAIESKVNNIITENSEVKTKLMSSDDAIDSGAMALFGEKYDEQVRVVSLGDKKKEEKPYSFELCGGTHVQRTGDIGAFKIINESAIAAGVRRIEAVCAKFAFEEIRKNETLLEEALDSLKTNKNELIAKINSLSNDKKELEKQLSKMQIANLTPSDQELSNLALKVNNVRLLYKQIDFIDGKNLRISAENLSKNHEDLIVVYAAKNGEKLSIVTAVSKPISTIYNAGNITKELAIFVGGNGGGQATLAQAGGSDISKISSLKEKLLSIING